MLVSVTAVDRCLIVVSCIVFIFDQVLGEQQSARTHFLSKLNPTEFVLLRYLEPVLKVLKILNTKLLHISCVAL